MALVVPLASSASVIENILFKVRRGIAMSRNATQANPATGVMVDLPEKIDFEMTLLKTHQSSSFERVVSTSSSETSGDSTSTLSIEDNSTKRISSGLEVKSLSEISSSDSVSSSKSLEISSQCQLGSEVQYSETTDADFSDTIGTEFSITTQIGTDESNSQSVGQEGSSSSSQGKKEEVDERTTKQTSDDSESEGRCTYQDHKANRYYDKFDTDTGQITGVSL